MIFRDFYHPIQPLAPDFLGYAEYPPCDALKRFIYCYWEMKINTTKKPENNGFYRAVADGCTDMIFVPNDSKFKIIAGFCDEFQEFPFTPAKRCIGVRFYPGGFTSLFGIKASELSFSSQYICDVIPDFYKFIGSRLYMEMPSADVIRNLDVFFTKRLLSARLMEDPRINQVIYEIFSSLYMPKVEKIVDAAMTSRHLRRLFDLYIGVSPKPLERVVRFQRNLSSIFFSSSLNIIGYYDQSQMIHDFQRLMGMTPTQLLKEKSLTKG
jgi:AraC-like DNA-binding protein